MKIISSRYSADIGRAADNVVVVDSSKEEN